jgi:hypothetical protein
MPGRHAGIAPHDGWPFGGTGGCGEETRNNREGASNDDVTNGDVPKWRSGRPWIARGPQAAHAKFLPVGFSRLS